MTEFQAQLVVVLSVAALGISIVSYFARNNGHGNRPQVWRNAVLSWSSGVMDEMETVLHIFKQLKYGASFDDVMDEIVVSKSTIKVLLDYGALLITHSLDDAGKEAVTEQERKDVLETVAAVYARLCLVADPKCRLDVEESILYVAQCRRLFVDEIRANMVLASPDDNMSATLWKN